MTKRQLSLTAYQYRDFLRLHCYGRNRAMTAEQIARETGISPRKQQDLKSDLLTHGVVICSAVAAPMGYYWPADDSEKVQFVRQLEHRLEAGAAALAIIYANSPALRPKKTRVPRYRHYPQGQAVTAQLELTV